MNFAKIEILTALEALSLISNGISLLTGLVLSVIVAVRSIVATINRIKINAEDFPQHNGLIQVMKSCAIYGFIFQFLGWLMFSSRYEGFMTLPELTNLLSVLWASLFVVNAVCGLISTALNRKGSKNILLKKKTWLIIIFTVLYFAVSFLIG